MKKRKCFSIFLGEEWGVSGGRERDQPWNHRSPSQEGLPVTVVLGTSLHSHLVLWSCTVLSPKVPSSSYRNTYSAFSMKDLNVPSGMPVLTANLLLCTWAWPGPPLPVQASLSGLPHLPGQSRPKSTKLKRAAQRWVWASDSVQGHSAEYSPGALVSEREVDRKPWKWQHLWCWCPSHHHLPSQLPTLRALPVPGS